jgi:hypothetical protein
MIRIAFIFFVGLTPFHWGEKTNTVQRNQKNMEGILMKTSTILLFVVFVLLPVSVFAQEEDINGTLVFESMFDDNGDLWNIIARNDSIVENLGSIEDGPAGDGGFALVIIANTFEDTTLNHIQFTVDDAFEKPEKAAELPFRFRFWIYVEHIPFTIRPIVFNNADPWEGIYQEIPIEVAGEWQFIDVTYDVADFLVTDLLSITMHMGNPGNADGNNEVRFDNLEVYLMDTVSVDIWEVY